MEQIETEHDGKRIKGEITMVISAWKQDEEYVSILRTQKFNPQKDAIVNVNLLTVAKKLNDSVDMSEHDFR